MANGVWMELVVDRMLGWVKLVPSRRRPGLQVPFILSSSSVGRFLFLFCIREQTLYYVVDLLGTSSTGDHVLRPRGKYNRY